MPDLVSLIQGDIAVKRVAQKGTLKTVIIISLSILECNRDLWFLCKNI